jgi:plasmid stability protein
VGTQRSSEATLRLWMIALPAIDGLTQARRLSEIKNMAVSLIAITLDAPASQVGVNIVPMIVHRTDLVASRSASYVPLIGRAPEVAGRVTFASLRSPPSLSWRHTFLPTLTGLMLRGAPSHEVRYHGISIEGMPKMTDVLIRDVPEEVIAALDSRASRLGLSRSEYLRRRLAQEAVSGQESVTAEHLAIFAETFADLADAEIMKGAWE